MTFKVLLSPPDVGELEQEYILRAMQSGWVAPAGPDLEAFETEVAARVGRSHAVALASGTAALHLALLSWGVGPGDVVPVSTLTFAATVNAIRYVGATPYFIDSDPQTGNMDPALLEQALVDITARGGKVPVVIPVDIFGKVADYEAIAKVVAPYDGIRILSDAAEAMGSTRDGRAAGSFGDAAVLSFNGNKIMTTSGGGMLVTDDAGLAAHARKLSTQAREPVAHYEHTEVGYNYRLSNILAALGRAQLSRLDAMIERRRALRQRYRDLFAEATGVEVLGGDDADAEDNCWLTVITVDPQVAGWRAADLGAHLAGVGVETRPVWKPMHLQPVNAGLPGSLNGSAERLFAQGLTLPSGSGLTDGQFAEIAGAITGWRS
ncbi:MAG TPA: aminotransferase class I/II-fold pyridoxal phosphate-dependent enzyme [Marmoricola sp.]|nr:aminotransferase class I/II-fold pyridoxal phosphate-dependent enzyme [Marmoricola sp.]